MEESVTKFNRSLLKSLCEAPGIPGREAAIRKLVVAEMAPLVDDLSVDVMGNVIGVKRGKGGPRVMIAAHMDEIGFFVSHIDKSGFLRIQPVGGFDARVLVAQRVFVHARSGEVLRGAMQMGGKPIHLLEASEIKPAKIEDIFIDLGLECSVVNDKVEIGDMVTFDRTLETVGDCVISKSLDDRVGVFVMLEALRAMKSSKAEIVAVATVQEEVGLRGAMTAAFAVEPDISIALDITLAGDIPDGKEQSQVTRLGGGAAIKIMDGYSISDPELVRHFRDVAEQQKIDYQLEILPRGGTDAGATQRARSGSTAITLSIPTRYVHTVNELARISDVEGCITLLARYLEVAGTRSYSPSL